MSFAELTSQVKTLWQFDYEPKIKALRELYEVAKKQQWNAATDIDWSLEIDRDGEEQESGPEVDWVEGERLVVADQVPDEPDEEPEQGHGCDLTTTRPAG